MQQQKQIDVNWDHRGHTRGGVQTGFQTAGILGNVKKAVFNPIKATKNQYRDLTGGGDSESDEPAGFDRFGTPVTDEEDVVTQDEDGVGPMGIPTRTWILGGAGVAAVIGIGLVYTGDDNSINASRLDPRN